MLKTGTLKYISSSTEGHKKLVLVDSLFFLAFIR